MIPFEGRRNEMLIFTITCTNNLFKAAALAKSVKKHMPKTIMVICLVEKTIHPAADRYPEFDEVVLAKHIGIPDFNRFLFKYRLVEGATAVKAHMFRYLLDRYGEE